MTFAYLIEFAIFFLASSTGIVIGVYMLFDSERRQCKLQIAGMRTDLTQARLNYEARERVHAGQVAALERKYAELAAAWAGTAVAGRPGSGPLSALNITNTLNTGDTTVGEVVGGNKTP